MAQPWRLARLEAYGVFNIGRLWYGILYYFVPIWTIIRPDGQFLFAEFETRMLDAVEMPPSSLLLSDPLLLMLAGAYLLRLPRLVRERLLHLRAVAPLMIGLLTPVFLILTFMYMAFRYRMEFYPFLEFSALLGFYAICVDPGEFSALSRSRLSLILISSARFGIVYSHFALVLHKISPPGNYAPGGTDTNVVSPANGWVAFYRFHFSSAFPSLAQRFHLQFGPDGNRTKTVPRASSANRPDRSGSSGVRRRARRRLHKRKDFCQGLSELQCSGKPGYQQDSERSVAAH